MGRDLDGLKPSEVCSRQSRSLTSRPDSLSEAGAATMARLLARQQDGEPRSLPRALYW